jgi:glycosyltransferase involved in cell wall biosynthesis
MIKVCHMTSAHPPGDLRILDKECGSLAKAGYEVYLVECGDTFEKNGVHVIGVGNISSDRIKRMIEGPEKVYRVAKALNADIYHFHDPELLPYGVKLKKAGKKVIFDSHEHTAEAILEKAWIPKPFRFLLHGAFSAYQAEACRKLNAVVTVTPHMVDYFRKRNPNTVMVANYPIISTGIKLEEDSAEKFPSIVFAGGISEQWNHEKIIRALERIPECQYWLLGNAEKNYLDKLKTLPGWKQVKYFGKVPQKEVAGILRKCSIGVAILTPGRNTGFQLGTLGNTKIFEEMMEGLPVICTDFVLWKEFIQRYQCGICIKPDSVDAIAAAIHYLLDHPKEARKMGENGRRAVEEEFNWRTEEKKLIELYKTLA